LNSNNVEDLRIKPAAYSIQLIQPAHMHSLQVF